MEKSARIASLDYMRALACLFVILTHSSEPFYIGAGDTLAVASRYDLFWVSVFDGFSRIASVPLFVLISSYLLLPMKQSAADFFKRRFVRIVIPFVVWLVIYAALPALWGEFPASDIPGRLGYTLLNFPPNAGHLWFVYMLIGCYLFIPVISPWLEKVSRRGEQAFLLVWLFTTTWPYLRLIKPELYGTSYWNEFHMLWNFSGYIGYMVLAHYIKKYVRWSLKKSLAVCVPAILVTAASIGVIFYFNTAASETLPPTELPWFHCSTLVAIMNTATFVLMLQITKADGWFYKIVQDISKLSYGMYLMHILLLTMYNAIYAPLFSTPVTILLTALSTYVSAYLVTKLLSLLPHGKYIVG